MKRNRKNKRGLPRGIESSTRKLERASEYIDPDQVHTMLGPDGEVLMTATGAELIAQAAAFAKMGRAIESGDDDALRAAMSELDKLG